MGALEFEIVATVRKFFSALRLIYEVKEDLPGMLIPAFVARQKVEKIVHAEAAAAKCAWFLCLVSARIGMPTRKAR